jgi:putative transposase
MAWLSPACAEGARRETACRAVGLSVRTWQRWQQDEAKADGRTTVVHQPANRLSDQERQRLLEVANTAEFRSLPPSQIVPTLADRGEYLASESTFYRVLRAADPGATQGASGHGPESASRAGTSPTWPRPFRACSSISISSWTSTALRSWAWRCSRPSLPSMPPPWSGVPILTRRYRRPTLGPALRQRGAHEGCYLACDPAEAWCSAFLQSPLGEQRQPLFGGAVSDPEVRPELLGACPFEAVEQARDWALGFQHWYNEEHKHSALKFVTPGERHRGEDKAILARRRAVYAQARAQHPERWSGAARDWDPSHEVWLNPPKEGRRKVVASQT